MPFRPESEIRVDILRCDGYCLPIISIDERALNRLGLHPDHPWP